MPQKLFLSFLGTSNYEPVSYYLHNERRAGVAPLEKYVQKTLLDHLSAPMAKGGRAVIFLTEEAQAANWLDNGHTDYKTGEAIPNRGLQQQIENANYPFPVEAVTVEGESEPEAIWRTFQTVYDQIGPGDEVYFDITHSWRYLPMLGMTLLNYAKVLRQIEVKAIYYGALEQLGTVFEVRQKPMDERPVPILNLVSFSDLQDWTVAADDFVQDGNPARLAQLTQKNITPILAESKGQDKIARNLRDITYGLDQLVRRITTSRGQQIWEYNYEQLHAALSAFSREQSYIKPLNGVIEHIRSKLSGFRSAHWLEAVSWCIDHQLIPQGITQLQEGLIAWLCEYYTQKGWGEKDYFHPYHNRKGRDLLSQALQFINYPPPEEKWRGQIHQHKQLGYQIMEDKLAQQLAAPFAKLAKARNDINHGGYTRNTDANDFYSILESTYQEIRQVLQPYLADEGEEVGLINLSNHPSGKWPAEQMEAAHSQYGRVVDMPFPQIDPNLDTEQLQALVREYAKSIEQIKPDAVHLMGEMTFTFALVQQLKTAGIPCLASTTHRKVEERDGKKIVQFEFVQFRPY